MPGHHHRTAGVSQPHGLPQIPILDIAVQEPRAECVSGTQDILNPNRKPRNFIDRFVLAMDSGTLRTSLFQHQAGAVI